MTAAPLSGPDAAPELSVIVVSYNTREMTLACLASLHAETRRVGFETIVVDNASADGSADAVEAAFPQVRLIRAGGNIGFAGANNLAAETARGALLLLLNPDTVVLRGAVDQLVEFSRARPDAGVWGGRTLDATGALDPASCWGDMTLWNLFCRTAGLSRLFPDSAVFNTEGYGGWLRDSERDVDIVSGCFLLIRTDLWRRLGGFDLSFVMYAEEADLCRRARALGARPRITPGAEIVHYGGASERVPSEKTIRLFKGKIALMRKHWSPPARWLGEQLFLALAFSRMAATAGRGGAAAGGWAEVWRRRGEWRSGYALGA